MVAAERIERPMEALNALEDITEGIDDERNGRFRWVYKLWERVRWLPRYGEDWQATLGGVAAARNLSVARIEQYLQVPERLPWHLLTDAFPDGPEGTCSWHLHLTWSHLEKAAMAGGDRYTSEQRVEWLIHAADNEMSLAQFTDWLRATGVIRTPRRGDRFTPEDGAREAERLITLQGATAYLKTALSGEYGLRVAAKAQKWAGKHAAILARETIPDTAITLLEALADSARAQGIDVPLPAAVDPQKAYKLADTLRRVADLIDQQRPGVRVTISPMEEGGTSLVAR